MAKVKEISKDLNKITKAMESNSNAETGIKYSKEKLLAIRA